MVEKYEPDGEEELGLERGSFADGVEDRTVPDEAGF